MTVRILTRNDRRTQDLACALAMAVRDDSDDMAAALAFARDVGCTEGEAAIGRGRDYCRRRLGMFGRRALALGLDGAVTVALCASAALRVRVTAEALARVAVAALAAEELAGRLQGLARHLDPTEGERVAHSAERTAARLDRVLRDLHDVADALGASARTGEALVTRQIAALARGLAERMHAIEAA